MRQALGYGILASASLLAVGYAGSTLTACSGAASDVPPAWDAPVTRPDDNTATQSRAACTYKRGDMPAATLGASTPVDKDIPITNVIVVMMENHSFDNYFGQLNKAQSRTDVECPDGGDTNTITTADGGTVVAPYAHAPHLCTLDTNH
jgi:phospholipase C